MLEMKDVCKGFGDRKILKGINLTVENGKIVGLLGKNGAGKTTMIKCINQLYRYDGMIRVKGICYEENPTEYLRNVGILLEPSYYDYMSALDNLKAYAGLCGVQFKDVEKGLEDLLDVIGLGNALDKKVRDFSFGMKQKLGVAMALVKKPDVLVLDEPSRGVDPKGLDALFTLMKDLARKEELAIIFSSNNLQEVQDVSDRISFLKEGEIVQTLDATDMLDLDNSYTIHVRHPLTEKIRSGLADIANCKLKEHEITVENNENLNRVLQLLLNNENPILDVARESRFLKEFYE